MSGPQRSRGRGRPSIEVDEALLLTAATVEFSEQGYRGARVEDVARRAGLAKTLLYRRFGSKDSLFAWTIEREVAFLTEYLFEAYERADESPDTEALRLGVGAVIEYATARPDGFALVFEPAHHAGASAAGNVISMVTDRVAEMVGKRLSQLGRPSRTAAEAIASVIVGASQQAARRCIDNRQLDPAAMTALVVELLSVGMFGLRDATLAALEPAAMHAGRKR